MMVLIFDIYRRLGLVTVGDFLMLKSKVSAIAQDHLGQIGTIKEVLRRVLERFGKQDGQIFAMETQIAALQRDNKYLNEQLRNLQDSVGRDRREFEAFRLRYTNAITINK